MENSVVDKILRAERRAADIENMSEKRAAERLLGAKERKDLIIKSAQNQGQTLLKERISQTKIKIQKIESESMAKTGLDITMMTEEAVKKFPEAIKRVKELLIY